MTSLLFADDVVLLASSAWDPHHVLGLLAAERKTAGMGIRASYTLPGHFGLLPQLGMSYWGEKGGGFEIQERFGDLQAMSETTVVKRRWN